MVTFVELSENLKWLNYKWKAGERNVKHISVSNNRYYPYAYQTIII